MERPQFIHYKLETVLKIEKVVSILYMELPLTHTTSGESHNFWELVYVDKGSVVAATKKEEFLLHEGEIIFHKPNEFHSLRSSGQIKPSVFIITFVCPSPAIRYFRGLHTHLPAPLRPLIREIIKERNATFGDQFLSTADHRPSFKENPILGGQQLIRNYLQILLIQLMRSDTQNRIFSNQALLNDHLTQQVVHYLEEHLYDGASIDTVCTHFNYSKTYLCTAFGQSAGMGIMQYYNRLRLEEAKRLLRDGSMTITQISDKLSFCNPHYFSHAFQKYVHMSPKQYRRSVRPD